MKKSGLLITILLLIAFAVQSQVAVNTDGSSANSSAMLDVKSTDKGMLIPRMTIAQRDGITNPVQGLIVYITNDNSFYYYNSSSWQKIESGSSVWSENGSTISVDSTKKVIIGDDTGTGTFQVITNQPTGTYTTDQCNGGTASASSSYAGKPASNVFDNNTSSYWSNDNALPVILQYDFGANNNKIITFYRIYFEVNYDVSPDTWNFQGSTDGSSWITLDNQSAQGWTSDEWKEYHFGNTTPYRYYRLNITNNKGSSNNYTSVYEVEMLESVFFNYPALFVDDNKVGVGTSTPEASFEVAGKIRIGDDLETPQTGEIRWNNTAQDFEGYNGIRWVSLTRQKSGWADNNSIHESTSAVSSDGATGDYFGNSVSISGDYAIVGADYKDIGSNSSQGKAYIFHRSGTSWTEQASLTASDGAAYDYFGRSVSISGDYAVIGAGYKDIGSNENQGKAYIFHRSGTSWTEQASLTASDGAADDHFGSSVSISGDYAVVAASYKDIGSNGSQGKAYIYYRSGTSWTEQVSLTASDGAADDYFGTSVSISGDYAVIGAEGKDIGSNNEQGKAYIFHRNGTSWAEQALLTASDGAASDYFGGRISISGDYAVVGAMGKDIGSNDNQGKAYIFHRSGTPWTEQASLMASDGVAHDDFGNSVSISGDYTVVGVFLKGVGSNAGQGKAYIFHRSGTSWTEQAPLTASDGATDDYFGRSVSISGDYAVVGAYYKNIGSNTEQGKVYFFPKN